MKVRYAYLLGTLLLRPPLAADELEDRLKTFHDAAAPLIEKLAAGSVATEGKRDERRVATAYVAGILARLGETGQRTQPEMIIRQIQELRDFAEISPELKTLLDGLATDLPQLAQQRVDRWVAEIDALVKGAGAACLAAKTEADLDPVLRELSHAASRMSPDSARNEAEQRAQRRLQSAIHTVSAWQDYLAHLTLGNPAGASAVLKRLTESNEYPIIAHAEIEKRISSPTPAKKAETAPGEKLAVLNNVQKIEDLESALVEIRRMQTGDEIASLRPVLQAFDRLVGAIAAWHAGFVGEAFQVALNTAPNPSSVPPEWAAQLNRLRGLLLVKVLPQYLELGEERVPNPEETASAYLLRLCEELLQQKRFAETVRVLETYRMVAFSGAATQAPSWVAADIEGLRAFSAATRLASAGSRAEAINNFRKAAEAAGKFTPSAVAAEQMAELQRAYPEEAKTAARLAETEALYQRLNRDVTEASRAIESRLPPDIRARMRPPGSP